MQLGDILRAIGRRWYVLLAGVLVTSVVAYAVGSRSSPDYSARGLVLLLPPDDLADQAGSGNPFLAMAGLALPADIVVVYLNSSNMSTEVLATAPDATYDAMIEPSTRGPLIAIEVEEPTPEGALRVLHFLADSIPSILGQLQDEVGAPVVARVTSIPLTLDTEAVASSGATRILIALVGGGLVVSLLLAIAVDGVLIRRRRSHPVEEHSTDHAAHEQPESLGADPEPSPVSDDEEPEVAGRHRDRALATASRSRRR